MCGELPTGDYRASNLKMVQVCTVSACMSSLCKLWTVFTNHFVQWVQLHVFIRLPTKEYRAHHMHLCHRHIVCMVCIVAMSVFQNRDFRLKDWRSEGLL